ncbi:protein kinase, putative [Bodo saltans]|uniref:Protein kinase, putative n=1 Tax=Bodo saltans TaxID=75058 RepID=A0A0S4INH1_BODSA|nr:protein kinase, putative [Bodo saltans]|eukprot:CUF66838.1 protein kinase, putative [Bodo saltans]
MNFPLQMDFSKSNSQQVTHAVGILLDPSPLQFVCGLFRRYHSVNKTPTVPVAMISLCATKKAPTSSSDDPHLVVVKEVLYASDPSSRHVELSHIHPLMRVHHLRKLVEAQRILMSRLNEEKLMSFLLVEFGSRAGSAGVSTNGLSLDGHMSESANGYAKSAALAKTSFAVVATVHTEFFEASMTLFVFQEYVPAQSLEQVLQVLPIAPPQVRQAAAGESDGGGLGPAPGNSGESDPAANSSGRKQPITFCRKLPVAHVVTAIFKEFLFRLNLLHKMNIPHAHIRPTSVLLSVDATDKGTDRYTVWLDNVNVLCTRSPLQDDDLWRWYAPEVSHADIADVEVRAQPWPQNLVEKWKRCDIFSAGLLLSFLLTGCCPFESCSSLSQMLARRTQSDEFEAHGLLNFDHYTKRLNPRSKTRNPHRSTLQDIVTQCTAWDPAARPAVEELIQAIEALYLFNPDADQHDDDADDGDNASHDAEIRHQPTPALPPPAPSPPLILQPPQVSSASPHFSFHQQSVYRSGSPVNPLAGRPTMSSTSFLLPHSGNILPMAAADGEPMAAADVSGGEHEEPVVSSAASHPSVRLMPGAHSASVDRRYHSSSSNNHNMGHMFIRSGSTNLNLPQGGGGLPPLATPADRNALSVAAAASELPQAGASNLFLFSQYNIAALTAAGENVHVKDEQIDAKELRAVILLRCFGPDEVTATTVVGVAGGGSKVPNAAVTTTDNGKDRLTQMKSGTSHWRFLAHQFAEIVLKFENCHPHQSELRDVFRQHSQAEAFWSASKKRQRGDVRLVLDKHFLDGHVRRVRPSELTQQFNGSALGASFSSAAAAVGPNNNMMTLTQQMDLIRRKADIGKREKRLQPSSSQGTSVLYLYEIIAYIRAAWQPKPFHTQQLYAPSRFGDASVMVPVYDGASQRQDIEYRQHIHREYPVLLMRVRMASVAIVVWVLAALVAALCRSLQPSE